MQNTLSDVVHACVVVGATDTKYQSAGRGNAVVLLAADPTTAATLIDRLPRRLRVLAPDMSPVSMVGPEAADRFDEWLHGFLDALGVAHASLITDSFFAAASLGFSLLDPERVYGVVVLTSNDSRPLVPDGARADRLRGTGPSLLLEPCIYENGVLADSVVDDIVIFLDGLA
jgi:hypothetical protein